MPLSTKKQPRSKTKQSKKQDICGQWRNEPTVNPLTGRKIKVSGKVFKDLGKKCDAAIEGFGITRGISRSRSPSFMASRPPTRAISPSWPSQTAARGITKPTQPVRIAGISAARRQNPMSQPKTKGAFGSFMQGPVPGGQFSFGAPFVPPQTAPKPPMGLAGASALKPRQKNTRPPINPVLGPLQRSATMATNPGQPPMQGPLQRSATMATNPGQPRPLQRSSTIANPGPSQRQNSMKQALGPLTNGLSRLNPAPGINRSSNPSTAGPITNGLASG